MYAAHLYILRSEWYNVIGYSSVGTCQLFGYGRYDYMFSEFDFLSGDVRWMDNYRHEDMLQVIYPNNYILDMECWCDWEEEHALEWTVRGNEVLYVGSFSDERPWRDREYFKNAS